MTANAQPAVMTIQPAFWLLVRFEQHAGHDAVAEQNQDHRAEEFALNSPCMLARPSVPLARMRHSDPLADRSANPRRPPAATARPVTARSASARRSGSPGTSTPAEPAAGRVA